MISVVVASHNGAQKLPLVLDRLIEASPPSVEFEVILVDNASDDGTGSVAQGYTDSLPITIIREPKPGKNIALNTALDYVRGNLIIFTDDDVVLPENFMTGYHEVAAREPGFSLFGGHIVPSWESEPDARILEEVPLVHAYTLTEVDRSKGPIKAGRLFGPNMAIRSSVFESGLRFDESIGPNGSKYVMGDETDLLQRAEERGFRAFFAPSVVVKHRISSEQLGLPWLRRRASLTGRTVLHNELRRNGSLPKVPLIFGFPRWALRKWAKAEVNALYFCMHPRGRGLHAAAWKSFFYRGYLNEFRRVRRLG